MSGTGLTFAFRPAGGLFVPVIAWLRLASG